MVYALKAGIFLPEGRAILEGTESEGDPDPAGVVKQRYRIGAMCCLPMRYDINSHVV